MSERDPYEVLGVPRTASTRHIRAAYVERARRLHPDLVGLRGLTPFVILIPGVFLLWSLLRLRRSRRVLRISFIDREDAQQRENQRRWNNSKSGSVQHDNSGPNKSKSYWQSIWSRREQ